MQTRSVMIGVVFVAAILATAVFLFGDGSAKPPPAIPQAASPPSPSKAPLPPSRQAEAQKPAAPATRTDNAVRLPATESYENSTSLRSLADAIRPALKSGDPAAARTMAKILGECAPLLNFPNYAESFRRGVVKLPPAQQSTALAHIGRFEQRCADLDRAEKLTARQLSDLEQRGMGVDDVIALAHRVVADPAALSASERADAVRRIITAHNGEAIFVLADAMEFVDDADNHLVRLHAGRPPDMFAWKLVGCALGAPCGPDSSFVRNNCITINNCIPGGYREHLLYYSLSPYRYELAAAAEQELLRLISSGRTEEILF